VKEYKQGMVVQILTREDLRNMLESEDEYFYIVKQTDGFFVIKEGDLTDMEPNQ